MNIQKAWDHFVVDYTHVHEINGNTYTSIIDHFFWNESVTSSVEEADVLHLVGNTSDHCPIYCKFSFGANVMTENNSANLQDTKARASWKEASPEQKAKYSEELENRLKLLPIPKCLLDCQDVKCDDDSHRLACDDYMLDVLACIENSAKTQIPQKCKNTVNTNKKKIPRWNNDIKPYKDDAYF